MGLDKMIPAAWQSKNRIICHIIDLAQVGFHSRRSNPHLKGHMNTRMAMDAASNKIDCKIILNIGRALAII